MDRQVRRRLAVLRHVEEVTGNVAMTCRCADHNEPLTNLFELIIGTGMRKGEALALHWADVHLNEHMLFVRHTLSNINNSTPVFTAPKTKSSLG